MIKAKPLTKRTKFTAAVNPQRKRKTRKVSGAPRRKNPGATVLLGYLNPEKTSVKQHKKTKKIRRSVTVKRNPFTVVKAKHSHRPRRRKNPISMNISKPVELLKAGAVGALAYFITRQVPQMILKGRNTSWVGYFANILTALGCAGVATKYLGPQAGQAAFVGGGMYAFGRVLNDQTPFGQALNLSGIGDPHAAAGLKGLVPGYFPAPAIVDRSGAPVFQPALVQAIKDNAPAPVPARAAAGMSGGRFASRW